MDVKEAISLVNSDYYMRQENGDLITQTTKPEAIESGLNMLDMHEGQNVLEIGTGSAYSTALLATLVGKAGRVVSVDIDPSLTQKAQKKLTNYPWVTCITEDGRQGYELSAPYDRIIAWTTPASFPDNWKKQLKETGMVVAPFQVLDIAQCTVMTRFKKLDNSLQGDFVQPEGYIPMTSEPVVNFDLFGPKSKADIVGEGDEPFWAGAHWMKTTTKKEQWIEKFLQAKPESSPFQENGQAVRAYMLSTQPVGFTFAFHPDHGDWIGYSTPLGFSLASFRQPNLWLISDTKHADVLRMWWSKWESLGKPSYEQLSPFLIDDKVKVRLKGGI